MSARAAPASPAHAATITMPAARVAQCENAPADHGFSPATGIGPAGDAGSGWQTLSTTSKPLWPRSRSDSA